MPAPDAPRIGVLALQGDVREHLHVLETLGARPVAVRRPSELASVDGLVLPGGKSTTMAKLARIFDLLEPLRDRVAEGLPMFGTCAGMILLAREVVDGRPDQQSFAVIDIAVRRNAYGRQRDSFEADLDIPALPGGSFRGVFIRAPRIETAGDSVEVLASYDGHPVLARQGPTWVASFHPELSGDLRLHEGFVNQFST